MTELRVYERWDGNPWGTAEDETCCIENVWRGLYTPYIPYQCRRKRGHGEGGLYCRQHAKQHPAKKESEE